MKHRTTQRWLRHLTVAGLTLLVWWAGYLGMRLPLGDGMLRLSYDSLHVFSRHRVDPRVLVIAMNEDTDRKLDRHQGEPFSRRDHTRLLQRLKEAGAERVCLDILFDLPSADPQVDEEFAEAIRAHGHVILGAAEETVRREGAMSQQLVIAPAATLREAAEGWGLLNVSTPDSDGVVRRFDIHTELAPAFAWVAARAETPELADEGFFGSWLHYQTWPREMPTVEFADCLDPQRVPDDVLRGKTVFVGGQYATDHYGRRDVFATPFTRFGEPDISGVAWHATAFLNARDQLWFTTAGKVRAALWCLPFAIGVLLVWGNQRRWMVIGAWALLGVLVALASLYLIWNDRILVNWMVPLLVQLPVCLLVLLVQQVAAPRLRWLSAAQIHELEHIEVFISFSSKDKGIASRLRDLLTENGHPAWLCLHDIRAGNLWIEAIAEALQKCRMVLFVRSKHSFSSLYCLNELMVASETNKPILPVSMDDSPVPVTFKLLHGTTQNVDAYQRTESELFPEVLAAVNGILDKERTGNDEPITSPSGIESP